MDLQYKWVILSLMVWVAVLLLVILENISVLFDILNADVTGIYVDRFTIDGTWSDAVEDNKLVTAFAPFSHDAQTSLVPVPAAACLSG